MRSVATPAVVALFLGLWASPAAAADYRIDSWTTQRGLPQNSVTSAIQSRDGYLWLGTFGGLVRFDGVAFTLVGLSAGDGLRSVRIMGLAEARDGALWIGTEHGGVVRYADGVFRSYGVADGLPVDTVSAVHADARGALWLATSRGAVRVEGTRFRTFTTRDGLPHDEITWITSDAAGAVWVGTGSGLARLDGERVTAYATGLADPAVTAVLVGRDGRLWAGTSVGLLTLDGGALVRVPGPRLPVRALHEDREGHLWVGTEFGLARFAAGAARTGAHVLYTDADGLSDLLVNTILEDREGNLWVGTNTGGLNRLKRKQLEGFGRSAGLGDEGTVPITEGRDGSIWIGLTCGGLARYRDGVFTRLTQRDGVPNECVWSLAARRDGSIWFGTWGGGLTRLEGGRFTTLTTATSGLPNDAVLALHEDRAGALWVGTLGGLARFHEGVFTTYRVRDGLVNDSVRFIFEDRDGALWLGTPGGVSRFADGRFTNYTTANGLSNDFVRAIHQTADGTMWLGTYGGGLMRFKNGRFTPFTTREGLHENIVSRILEDADGHFWLSGNNGIARVARRQLDDVADGRASTVSVTSYGVTDGMPIDECNGGGQPAGWRSRDGALWFPTARGVVRVDPRRTRVNPTPPQVAIERVRVDHREQPARDAVEVAPRAGTIEIAYTGLSFTAPERVRFRYRLAGADPDWVEAGTRRSVAYSRLPPGRYTFEVTAANADGVWAATPSRLALVVVPAFYQTWWFLGLMVAGTAGLLFWISERRLAGLRRAKVAQETYSRRLIESQEAERKRIAGELHDSLSQTLVVIKNRALIGLQEPDDGERALEQMEEIADAATSAIDEIRQIAYDLRPYHLDQLGLRRTIEVMLERLGRPGGVRFTADVAALDGALPKAAEIGVYRIIQEAATNVVKHAAATTAHVEARRAGPLLTITVRDDGRGFDPAAVRVEPGRQGGFGLVGLAERARLLGSDVAVDAAPGAGTTIRLTLDLRALDEQRDTRPDRG